MVKIIEAYQNLQSAQEALKLIVESVGEPGRLSIIGPGQSQINDKSRFNKPWLWGVALGAVVGFALPGGGHLLLAGHLARAVAMHALGVTAKGIIAGAATGGTVDLLRYLGFDRRSDNGSVAVADRCVRVVRGSAADGGRPLLNHLALLVEDAKGVQDEAEGAGLEVDDVKDAKNTFAVFVRGPEGVRVEYVEHKPGFALV